MMGSCLYPSTNSRHKLRLGRGRKKESLEILFFWLKLVNANVLQL